VYVTALLVPAGELTVTWTDPEPGGAVTLIELSDALGDPMVVEPHLTVPPVSPEPLMVTGVPGGPLEGLRAMMGLG